MVVSVQCSVEIFVKEIDGKIFFSFIVDLLAHSYLHAYRGRKVDDI